MNEQREAVVRDSEAYSQRSWRYRTAVAAVEMTHAAEVMANAGEAPAGAEGVDALAREVGQEMLLVMSDYKKALVEGDPAAVFGYGDRLQALGPRIAELNRAIEPFR